MSIDVARAAAQEPALRGSLLRSEALRLRSRRMVRILLALGALGLLGGIIIASTQFAKPSAAGLANAKVRAEQVLVDVGRNRQQCLSAVGTPSGPPSKDQCGPPLTLQDIGGVEAFIDKRPFTLSGPGRGGVLGVAAAAAGIAFLLGATYVGAEWSSRSMVALLFWEPRRRKVMATKLTVLVALTALLGAVAEAVWLAAAQVLATTRGTAATPHGLWGELIGSAGRGVLLVVLVGLLGFGVANLLRNTAAAFGVGFVYFAIVENVLRVLRPRWQEWLITNNAVALLHHDGLRLFISDSVVDARGGFQTTRQLHLTNVHGALVIGAVTAVVVLVGVVLFTRRDLD